LKKDVPEEPMPRSDDWAEYKREHAVKS
jgi:hypothetical protein